MHPYFGKFEAKNLGLKELVFFSCMDWLVGQGGQKMDLFVLPSMVLVELVKLVIYVDWPFHIPRDLQKNKNVLILCKPSLSTEDVKTVCILLSVETFHSYLEGSCAGLVY